MLHTEITTKCPQLLTSPVIARHAAARQQSNTTHQLPLSTSTAVLRSTAALFSAVCLHLGHPDTALAAHFEVTLSSVAEDKLLETVRGFESRFSGALNQLKDITTLPGSSVDKEASQKAQDLVREVWEVVDTNFSDVRAAGYSTDKWKLLLEKALRKPLRDQSSAYSVVRELLAELHDPYSRFLTPTEFSAMAKYDISGVGLNLGTTQEFESKTGIKVPEDRQSQGAAGVWVVGLIQGSLADGAGIRQGDELVAADGVPLTGQSPFQVASLLQGNDDKEEQHGGAPSSSPVVDLVLRGMDGSTRQVQLHRPAPVVRRSPVSFKLDKDVGYVKLASFDARAQRDVALAVGKLQSEGASRLVLDLRGNRGGLVSEGVEVAKLFLQDSDIVVRTVGKSRSAAPLLASGPPLTTLPLVVLVDGGTASASEIAAGALSDNCRAVLVGGRTYGKGLIQSVYELNDGSGLVLTVGKYTTPAGTDIDREGLEPKYRSIPGDRAMDEAIKACKVARKG